MSTTDSTLLDYLSSLTTFRVQKHSARVVIYGSGGEQIGSGDTLRGSIVSMMEWLGTRTNTVTQSHVDAQIVDIDVATKFDKVTVVTVRLRNGFVLVESAGAVDKANYSEEVGREICLSRIKNRIWELEGYVLSTRLYETRNTNTGRPYPVE